MDRLKPTKTINMTNLDTATILRRSVQGVLSFVSRSLFIQIINIASMLVLAAYLNESAFGVFYIVSAVIAFLMYFSDIGLAAALIQKKGEVTDNDLRTTFTIQQILVVSLVVIALSLSGVIAWFYHLDTLGLWLFQALVISFFLSSLKTIPSVLLERRLDFSRLVIPQIAETIVYNGIVVILAIRGWSVLSFAIAILARGIIGLIVIYIISPWKPSIGISKESAKKLLSFGFPFQINSVLALLKDDMLTIFLGKILTRGEMGLIGFSQKLAYIPLRFAMDNVIRITFPSFSRLQGNLYALKTAIEKTLFIIVVIVAPMVFGLVVLSPYLVSVIPKYSRWEPALLSLTFFAGNALLSSISTPLTNFLNAIGKVKTTLKLMTFWLMATWLATLLAVKFFGYNGVAIASFAVSLSVFLVIFIARKHIEFNIVKSTGPPLASSIIMGILIYFLARQYVVDIPTLLATIAAGAIIYFAILYALAKNELKRDILLVIKILRKEQKTA